MGEGTARSYLDFAAQATQVRLCLLVYGIR